MKTSDTKQKAKSKQIKTTKTKQTKKVTSAIKTVSPAVNDTIVKKGCSKCTSCQDEMTEAFIQEVTEDVKNDNLKAFWNKYGLYVIIFVVLSVSAAVGFETIKSWHNRQLQAKTEAYLSAMVQKADYEVSIKSLEKIASGKFGIYSEMARIQIADILFEQNKTEEALHMLQSITDNDELSPKVRNLAALKLATYKIDTATHEELLNLLTPVAEANNAWSPMAKDMLAMISIEEGNFEEARKIYNELLQNTAISENFRNHIQDMLSALSDM